MKLAPKDAVKVRQLHSELMSVADKYEMSMEDLLEMAMEGEEPEMEQEMGEPEEEGMEAPAMEGEERPMDKAKIALIIGKMRKGQME